VTGRGRSHRHAAAEQGTEAVVRDNHGDEHKDQADDGQQPPERRELCGRRRPANRGEGDEHDADDEQDQAEREHQATPTGSDRTTRRLSSGR
jgi:hypothetical protein